MFSLDKHLKTVRSFSTDGLKYVSEVTGVDLAKPAAAIAPTEKPKTGPIPKRDTSRGTRILSLDGGGVRGYSALMILDDFMKRVNIKLKAEGKEEVIPADFFDLIIGTSTGGIMALMLGRMRMSVGECINAYRNLSCKIFAGGVATTLLSGGPLGKGPGLGLGMGLLNGRDLDTFFRMAMSSALLSEPALYDAARLEKHVKRTIKAQAHTWDNDEAFLEEKNANSCHTAVVAACQLNATTPHLMRSYDHEDYPTSERVRIWEAARATSAAPAFFAPITIGDKGIMYVDGAVTGHCNPTTLAREEAEYLWRDPDNPRENVLLLSLGTGAPTAISLAGQLPQKLVGFIGLSANAIHTAEASTRYYNQRYEKNFSPYIRLSVPHDIDAIRLDDYEKLPAIAAATSTYLLKEEAKALLFQAVNMGLGYTKPQKRIRKGTADISILTSQQSLPVDQNTSPLTMTSAISEGSRA